MTLPLTDPRRCRARIPAFALAAALALLAGLDAHGQSPPVPESLKGLKQANGTCPRDEPMPPAQATPVHAEPDLACALSSADALALQGAADVLFVDTRLPAEHGQFGIHGAVNLSVSALRSKSYLKSKRIVLFGTGKGEQELYRACTALKSAGFANVRVLQGGLASWLAAQQPLDGRVPTPLQMTRLTASEFWQESQFDENVVLVSPARQGLQAKLSFSVLLPQVSTAAVKSVLERRRRELKGAPMAAVVLAAGNEFADADILALQQALKPVPVLWYPDTEEALAQQMARQQAVWTAQARGPKKPPCVR